MTDRRIRGRERLSLQSDFERVFARRCRAADGVLIVFAAPNGLAWTRLGIRVSRRVGGAVTRNYVRRRIRAAFQHLKSAWPVGIDFICLAQPHAARLQADVERSLRVLAEEAIRRFHPVERRSKYLPGSRVDPT